MQNYLPHAKALGNNVYMIAAFFHFYTCFTLFSEISFQSKNKENFGWTFSVL